MRLFAIILTLIGLALTAGGIWLVALGGSVYFALAGAALLVTSYFLFTSRPIFANYIYALFVLGSIIWALLDSGFDWWPLASRMGPVQKKKRGRPARAAATSAAEAPAQPSEPDFT